MIERCSTGRFSETGGEYLDLLLLAPDRVRLVEHLIDDRTHGRPLADLIDPEERRRVELTVSCRDTEALPKVADAGSLQRMGDELVQIMHNGVAVVAGGYYGTWMTEIIQRLHGHHEPQEELVFHEIVERLAGEPRNAHAPVIVELGAFWSYYALWFLRSCDGGRAVLVEPDPTHLSIASRNLALNDSDALILQAAIGDTATDVAFGCENGDVVIVDMVSLTDVLDAADITRADIVVSDIQGAETHMLELACAEIAQRVRFLVMSTHHASISGHPDTHERCLSIIQQCGGHIIAEHTVSESFSGDGLIAASFDSRDREMHVEISRARSECSLFRSPVGDLVDAQQHASNLERSFAAAVEYARSLEHHAAQLEQARSDAAAYAASLEQEVAKHQNTFPVSRTARVTNALKRRMGRLIGRRTEFR
jgi:FkbM family methyltransferase